LRRSHCSRSSRDRMGGTMARNMIETICPGSQSRWSAARISVGSTPLKGLSAISQRSSLPSQSDQDDQVAVLVINTSNDEPTATLAYPLVMLNGLLLIWPWSFPVKFPRVDGVFDVPNAKTQVY